LSSLSITTQACTTQKLASVIAGSKPRTTPGTCHLAVKTATLASVSHMFASLSGWRAYSVPVLANVGRGKSGDTSPYDLAQKR
jgi:hypothetical protein